MKITDENNKIMLQQTTIKQQPKTLLTFSPKTYRTKPPVVLEMQSLPRISLSMIVKNEIAVIERMLSSVLPLIDCFVICDTGSTDNTAGKISEFMSSRGVAGIVIHEPFRDFGYNRSFALTQTFLHYPEVEYVLLMDADMILQMKKTPQELKQALYENQPDLVHFFQGDDHFSTRNARLCRNVPYSYIGMTHEYLNTPATAKAMIWTQDIVFIRDVGDGGSKHDKFQRDICLLKRGLEKEPTNGRYLFYLANSYKDSGQYEDAIATYQRKINNPAGNWFEEVWYSQYSMGGCYKLLGRHADAVFAWFAALETHSVRIENLYEIVKLYRELGKHKTAVEIYEMAKRILQQKQQENRLDFLFTQRDVYLYKLDYEMTILGYYYNPNNVDLPKLCMELLSKHEVWQDRSIYLSILQNYKYYAEKIATTMKNNTTKNNTIQTILQYTAGNCLLESCENGVGGVVGVGGGFVGSTPSLVFHNKELWMNRRWVNYRIDNGGSYNNQSQITTINTLSSINPDTTQQQQQPQTILQYDTKYDEKYVGLEDVRLFSHQGKLYYNANRGLVGCKMRVEHGVIDTIQQQHDKQQQPTNPTTNIPAVLLEGGDIMLRDIEKNWVMFATAARGELQDCLRMVYSWSPLIIGRVEYGGNKFVKTHETPSNQLPAFFRDVRGSTNGVLMEDCREIWFLCHLVSYEDRRRYYHLFVVLNAETLCVEKYSPLFTFTGACVEYSLGFVVNDGSGIVIGYSVNDCSTEFVCMDDLYGLGWNDFGLVISGN